MNPLKELLQLGKTLSPPLTSKDLSRFWDINDRTIRRMSAGDIAIPQTIDTLARNLLLGFPPKEAKPLIPSHIMGEGLSGEGWEMVVRLIYPRAYGMIIDNSQINNYSGLIIKEIDHLESIALMCLLDPCTDDWQDKMLEHMVQFVKVYNLETETPTNG